MICFNIIQLYTIISALVCDLQHKSKCAGHLAYLSPYRNAINVPDDAAPKLDSLELRADVWAAPDHRNRCSAGPPPLLNGDYCGGLKTEQVSAPGRGLASAKGTGFHESWPFKWVQCDTMHGSAVTFRKQGHMLTKTPWPSALRRSSGEPGPNVTCGDWDSAGITTPQRLLGN